MMAPREVLVELGRLPFADAIHALTQWIVNDARADEPMLPTLLLATDAGVDDGELPARMKAALKVAIEMAAIELEHAAKVDLLEMPAADTKH